MDTMVQEVMSWDITSWALSDMGNLMWAVAAVAALGALNGVRLSLAHGGRTAARRGGRRQ